MPAPEPSTPSTQPRLIHGTSTKASLSIPQEGFKLTPGRRGFRFDDSSYSARQRHYLTDSAGRKGVWILIDPTLSAGCEFMLLPNGVDVKKRPNGQIPNQSILAIWKVGNITHDMTALGRAAPEIVFFPGENASMCRSIATCVDRAMSMSIWYRARAAFPRRFRRFLARVTDRNRYPLTSERDTPLANRADTRRNRLTTPTLTAQTWHAPRLGIAPTTKQARSTP